MSDYFSGRKMQGHALTIASVFPRKLEAQRDYHPDMSGGRFKFVIEAAAKGEYRTLTISDCWEQEVDEHNSLPTVIKMRPKMVRVEDIAPCLMKEWTMDVAGTRNGRRPGVMIIAGEVPTEAELAALNQMQAAYFDGLILEARASAAQHKWREINDLHREAAKWRGVDEPWVANVGEGQEKVECHWCAEKILARAKFCRFCQKEQPQHAVAEAPKAPEQAKTIQQAKNPGRPPLPPPMTSPAHTAA